jgi:hypothetical protein
MSKVLMKAQHHQRQYTWKWSLQLIEIRWIISEILYIDYPSKFKSSYHLTCKSLQSLITRSLLSSINYSKTTTVWIHLNAKTYDPKSEVGRICSSHAAHLDFDIDGCVLDTPFLIYIAVESRVGFEQVEK